MDYNKESIKLHKKYKGKLTIESKVPVNTMDDLSLAYTPGVGAVCKAIENGEVNTKDVLTSKNTVAIITDGSAILGLGNIGAVAGLPVMEGKSVLLKSFAGVDSFPIALDTQNVDEIVTTIKNIAPTFGAINLEDISAPRCFEVEKRLSDELDIPVFHDDQHGTAIVILSGLINTLKVVNKKKEDVKLVINGAGAAGFATADLLNRYGFKNIFVLDSSGVITKDRACGDDNNKKHFCDLVSKVCDETEYKSSCEAGSLQDVIVGADIFIGVSAPGVLTKEMVKTMSDGAVIFAMANPVPEIMPDDAKLGGARIVATGRSDFANQVNNALVFPGIFKGAFENNINKITMDMKISVAEALAGLIKKPTEDNIIPNIFDDGVVEAVAGSVK